jgi:hypothetical protein
MPHPHDTKSSPDRPTVRSATIRKGGRDGSLSPTEQLKKNRLMKQFSKQAKGYAVGVSQAYRDGYDGISWK